MYIWVLILTWPLARAWPCLAGQFIDKTGECYPCTDSITACAACNDDGTRCFECFSDYFLDENRCIEGFLVSECEPITEKEACNDCFSDNCGFCEQFSSACHSCNCAKCKVQIHYDETITLLNGDEPEKTVEVTSFYLLEEEVRCLPSTTSRDLAEGRANLLVVKLQEPSRSPISIQLELAAEYNFGTQVNLILHFNLHATEIEFFYQGEQASPYTCWQFDSNLDQWISNCSLLLVLQHAPQPTPEAILKTGGIHSFSVLPLIVPLVYLGVYLVLRHLRLKNYRPRNSSYIAQPIDPYVFNKDPSFRQLLEGASELPHDIIIIHSTKTEEAPESPEEVGSPMSFRTTYWEVFRYNYVSRLAS